MTRLAAISGRFDNLPAEIENVLSAHPGMSECAVIDFFEALPRNPSSKLLERVLRQR